MKCFEVMLKLKCINFVFYYVYFFKVNTLSLFVRLRRLILELVIYQHYENFSMHDFYGNMLQVKQVSTFATLRDCIDALVALALLYLIQCLMSPVTKWKTRRIRSVTRAFHQRIIEKVERCFLLEAVSIMLIQLWSKINFMVGWKAYSWWKIKSKWIDWFKKKIKQKYKSQYKLTNISCYLMYDILQIKVIRWAIMIELVVWIVYYLHRFYNVKILTLLTCLAMYVGSLNNGYKKELRSIF